MSRRSVFPHSDTILVLCALTDKALVTRLKELVGEVA
jgi:hypothetical protein